MAPTETQHDHSAPTQHDFTVSLNHVMERFNAEGIGRTKRRLAELCQKGTLEGKKFKTTHGDTWFVTAASLDAAVQQIKTEERLAAAAGSSRREPAAAGRSQQQQAAPNPAYVPAESHFSVTAGHAEPSGEPSQEPADAGGRLPQHATARSNALPSGEESGGAPTGLSIFEHPYVLKLERRNDQLEQKLDEQTRRTELIQREAFDRLVELQRSSQIAQSQTLADFFIKTRDFLLGRKASENEGAEI